MTQPPPTGRMLSRALGVSDELQMKVDVDFAESNIVRVLKENPELNRRIAISYLLERFIPSDETVRIVYRSMLDDMDNPKGRSLNPTPQQMQHIKAKHLERLFERTKNQPGGGITPAMRFYGLDIGPVEWVERPMSYVNHARYRNNFVM